MRGSRDVLADDIAVVVTELVTNALLHGAPPVRVRLSFPRARLEAGPDGARWEGGAALPLLPVPDRRAVPRPVPAGADLGLLATNYGLGAGNPL